MRIRSAAAVLAVGAAVAVGGVAGAAEEHAPATIYVSDAGGHCFTVVSGKTCEAGEHPNITIQAGETVTWDFGGTVPGNVHNVHRQPSSTTDGAWDGYSEGFVSSGSHTARFDGGGVYEFLCQAHAGMGGTIVVEGAPTVTPTVTPTPTPTPTASATPAATAVPDDHLTTPAPTGGAKDAVAPRVGSVRTSAQRRAVVVRFWLSEPSTVVIRAKRSRTVVASATVQAAAGSRTYTLRSPRLTKGRYTVSLRAADPLGNSSAAATATLRMGR